MTWHLMGVSPNKTLSHLLYFLGSIFRSHETIWKGSSVEQDGATRRKLVRLAQFADGHRNCSCCGVKYHQTSFSRQKPVDAYWNMQEHQGGTGGKPIEINWDTALQRYFPSVWHNCELIHVFIFSTLLTAPFWFSTVCYRVLRTIEIIHDPIHLGEKNTRVVVVWIRVWGHGPRVSDVSYLTCIQWGRGSCEEELVALM